MAAPKISEAAAIRNSGKRIKILCESAKK